MPEEAPSFLPPVLHHLVPLLAPLHRGETKHLKMFVRFTDCEFLETE
jgi:hypothetical protein